MKQKEWVETIHNDLGYTKIHYTSDYPIGYEEFVYLTRSIRPQEIKRIESRFEILDL